MGQSEGNNWDRLVRREKERHSNSEKEHFLTRNKERG